MILSEPGLPLNYRVHGRNLRSKLADQSLILAESHRAENISFTSIDSNQAFFRYHSSRTFLLIMRPFKRPPVLLPHCSQCLHRTISTSATATRKRRNQRHIQNQREKELQERAEIMRTRIHEARIARREDWILGPLAPRRDTEDNGYGTMSTRELHGMKGGLGRGVLTERGRGGVSTAGKKGKRNGKGKGVGMSWKESLIYRGDRVAVVSRTGPESREWGKIGVVEHVWRDRREVLVNGLNMVGPSTCSVGFFPGLMFSMVVASCFWAAVGRVWPLWFSKIYDMMRVQGSQSSYRSTSEPHPTPSSLVPTLLSSVPCAFPCPCPLSASFME